ncbi:MAG: hypothetical protein E7231_11520 [Cellulosilyticum sp.]|nr:hypothetical protein [Cellulosilyticum sp.]
MPYIFHSNNYFTLIDSTPKNGTFCKFFSSNYTPKPIQIYPQQLASYDAHMDLDGKLYVATMPDAFQLNYYIYEGNRFNRNTLISNTNSNYQLSSPIMYTINQTPFITYLSHQTHSTTYNFVQENLHHPHLITLLTCYSKPSLIKSYKTDNEVFVFFITYEESYQLNLLHINEVNISSSVYLNSTEPITDYSICIENDTIHITYVVEFHGKYQLAYFNNHSSQITTLVTTQYPSNPVVFCYYDMIWINALINHKLQMLLSIDNGQTFSQPAPCSLQNNIHRSAFLTHKSSTFICQELYASIASTIKLCTLAMIDLPRFHTDTMITPELELLLEGLILSRSTQETEATHSPNQNANPYTTPESVPSSSGTPTLKDAKSAFMNELTSWDLPPRV